MKKHNNNGFTLIEILLVIVTLAIVGLAGFIVARHIYKNNLPVASSSSVSTIAPKSSTQTKYLTITEWGVRIPYVSTDTLSYNFTQGVPNIANIVSKSLSDNYDCTTFGAGQISRSSPSDQVNPTDPSSGTVAQAAAASPSDYKLVGGYYYLFIHDQAACSDASAQGKPASSGGQTQQSANSFTSTLISKIEATP